MGNSIYSQLQDLFMAFVAVVMAWGFYVIDFRRILTFDLHGSLLIPRVYFVLDRLSQVNIVCLIIDRWCLSVDQTKH